MLPTLLELALAARHGRHHAGHQRPEAVPSAARRSRRRTACGGWCRSSAALSPQRGAQAPEIVIVAPPRSSRHEHPEMLVHFGDDASRVEAVRQYYKRAPTRRRGFFDAATVAKPTRPTASISMPPTPAPSARAWCRWSSRCSGCDDASPFVRRASPMPARSRCWSISRRMAASRAAGPSDEAPRAPTIRSRSAGSRCWTTTRVRLAQRDDGGGRRRGGRHAARLPQARRVRADAATTSPAFMRADRRTRSRRPTATGSSSMLGVHVALAGQGRRLGAARASPRPSARETQARGLALIVEDANDGARRLYERRGFAVRTRRPMVPSRAARRRARTGCLMVKD